MRIMIDTNVLVSAVLFPKSKVANLIWDILLKHELVISSYAIEELKEVFRRKFEDKMVYLDKFLSELSFELAFTPDYINANEYPEIRDPKDLPILVSAILSDVDVLVTGDKDFKAVEIEKPMVLTPNEYLDGMGYLH